MGNIGIVAPPPIPEYPNLRPFLPGHAPLPGCGRPLGSKSKTLFLKAETRITKEFLKRAVAEDKKFSTPLLAKAIDKYIPDASIKSSVGDAAAPIVVVMIHTSDAPSVRVESSSLRLDG